MANTNDHDLCVFMQLEAVSELLELVGEDRAESAPPPVICKDSRSGRMHILLDILLTDSWDMALIKVALATQATRSDFRFETDMMRRFGVDSWEVNRRRCRHFARRMHGDEEGLDLLWLMLAANPAQPWTYGFMPRLTDAVNVMSDQLLAAEERLLDRAFRRLENWQFMRDGFPATCEDPFKQVTLAEWGKALAAKEDRDRVAVVAATSSKSALARFREQAKITGEPVFEDAQDDLDEVPAGVVVIAAADKLQPTYKALAACRTSLAMTPNVVAIRNALRLEFPHALAAIDLMLTDLREGEPIRFRPFLLVSEPGAGKSRLIRRMAELLGTKLRRYDAAGSSDNAFAGTPKRWHSASPCFPLMAVADSKLANPLIMIDEVDKGGQSSSGSLAQALMPFLERETSRAYPDQCFEIECDLSHVNYCMTANDDSKLPSPLKDRIRVIKVPSPGRAHITGLAASIMKDLAVELALPAAFMAPLAPDELAVVARAWGDDGSVRKLQKIVSATVRARDEHASRH
jgi:hypothetical protein